MRNYKQILEAVNRGIQLALDDFDDDQVLNIKSKQVLNRDYTKEYLDLLSDAVVDLGLPSGTLWCKYNLGVNSNLLKTPENWFGDYYAWGELEGNKTNKNGEIYFNWDNYKFALHGKSTYLTKYITNEKYMHYMSDNLVQLQNEDDVAYQLKKCHNFKFHIPTKELLEELINCTNSYWINNYDPNKTIHNPKDDGGIQSLNGRIFEGNNGNQLFIPAAGYCSHSNYDIYSVGSRCDLWSSSLDLDNPSNAYHLFFYSDCIDMRVCSRYFGHSVRPVINL